MAVLIYIHVFDTMVKNIQIWEVESGVKYFVGALPREMTTNKRGLYILFDWHIKISLSNFLKVKSFLKF